MVVKFIFIKKLNKPVRLGQLWDKNYIPFGKGPRSFDGISDAQFEDILLMSETTIKTIKG